MPDLTLLTTTDGSSPAFWTIWRSGTELFHVIECADYQGLLAALAGNPVNQRWQERMAGLLAAVHDYSEDGAEAALPVVWQLPR